jgi:two-component system nitrogen regulation sensor histidine kinase NtrY
VPKVRDKKFIIVLLLTICAFIASLVLHGAFPVLESSSSVASNLGFLLLINLNIVAVMVLGFVVLRNIIRLILDRRQNILGARLKSRLVLAFILLSLVPTVLLFGVAQGMLDGMFKDWFSPKVEEALEASRSVANRYYELVDEEVNQLSRALKDKLEQSVDIKISSLRLASDKLEKYHVSIYDSALNLLESKGDIKSALPDPNLDLLRSLDNRSLLILPESFGGKEIVRSYSIVQKQNAKYYLVVSKSIAPDISNAVSEILNANDEYRDFKSYQRPLASGFFSTLVVVTLLIIFGAISVGFFLARGLTGPIGLLAKGTEQIANGNLNFHIPEFGDDELTVLVRSFNKMTSDLRLTTEELVSRRRYIETVLSNVGVGVLSVNQNGLITTINSSIYSIFELNDSEDYLDREFNLCLPETFVQVIDEMIHRSLRGKVDSASRSFLYQAKSEVRNLQLMVTKLYEEKRRQEMGVVILVDDVTELERAQRMSAWQEVAKRIAHEIKNPLTPIQLSAERIQRMKERLPDGTLSFEDSKLVTESVSTIVKQVENMRVLVNEFSQFARLPRSNILEGDIISVIKTVVDGYRSSRPDIEFSFEVRDVISGTLFDSHQIERVVINIIDNAISSLDEKKVHPARIEVKISEDVSLAMLVIEFIDNGLGVRDSDKGKLFEPYFSKKVGGTGLGLAIVKSVISDHNGFIRVSDTLGGGLTIRIELPTVNRR